MNTQATINQQIAGARGDAGGSYEQLIGSHICDALGVAPTHRRLLVPAPKISSEAATWLRQAVDEPDLESEHAAEVLAVLKLWPRCSRSRGPNALVREIGDRAGGYERVRP